MRQQLAPFQERFEAHLNDAAEGAVTFARMLDKLRQAERQRRSAFIQAMPAGMPHAEVIEILPNARTSTPMREAVLQLASLFPKEARPGWLQRAELEIEISAAGGVA